MTDAELVREVAEKVMRWEEVEDMIVGKVWAKPDKSVLDFRVVNFDPLHDANHWMMVERMREKDWELYFHSATGYYSNNNKSEKVYRCCFSESLMPKNESHVSDIQPGRAICLAALEAVEK